MGFFGFGGGYKGNEEIKELFRRMRKYFLFFVDREVVRREES